MKFIQFFKNFIKDQALDFKKNGPYMNFYLNLEFLKMKLLKDFFLDLSFKNELLF